MTISPCGSWSTPITSEVVAASSVRVTDVAVDGTDVWWSEGRASEGGRIALVRHRDGAAQDVLPDDANARTAVHEYGGAAWWVREGVVWFVEWADQRLYRLQPGGTPVPLTAEPATPRADRYADGDVSGDVLVCVRERHGADGVRNEIVRLAAHTPSEPEVLVSGPDFVAAPRLGRNGETLAWLQWSHPSMPWDAVELVVRDLAGGEETVVAGGPGESVTEPTWQDDGALWFVSDRTDWWNLYRWVPGRDIESMVRTDAEIGVPGWALGASRYAVLPDGTAVFARSRGGLDALAIRGTDGLVADLDLPVTHVPTVRAAGPDAVVVVAASPEECAGVHRVWRPGADPRMETLFAPPGTGLDPAGISRPEPVTFGSHDAEGGDRVAHALFYPPTSATHAAPDGELPPLLVMIHGGPTAAAVPAFAAGVQYWTSRGIAVVEVNHGGSTGYGRTYRDELLGQWGVLDVTDCLAAVRHLAARGRVDPERLLIRGGSAGGFTVLNALAADDTPFAAGADHYGVADLEVLAAETHKFESRYLDRLIGPYPQDRETYRQRSPLHHPERLRRPLIVLQGSEDLVVPPRQSEMVVEALRAAGVPVAYLLFDGEQHGFRRAENIRRALDAELAFYARILGFDLPPDEDIAPVEIENL